MYRFRDCLSFFNSKTSFEVSYTLYNCWGVCNLEFKRSVMVRSLTLSPSLTSGLYKRLQFHPWLLRKICFGSLGGFASWYSSGANQSQQGINSSLNLALTKRSTLGSRPCQSSIIPSHERLTAKAATPVIRHKPPAKNIFILKKQIYQGRLI